MVISGTTEARGLKFWLQVALGALIKPCRLGGDPDIRIPEIRIFEKSGFPGSEPDFRISVHGVEIGAPRATCSQNFRPLAAILLKLIMAFENDNYILDNAQMRVRI